MKILVLVIFVSSLLFSFNFKITSSTILNGKTSLIEFEKGKNCKYKEIIFNKKSFKIYQHPTKKTKMYALLPISYYEKPENKTVDISYVEKNITKVKTLKVKIKDGEYKKEEIQVNKSKVNPTKKYTKRISQEYKEAMQIYNSSTKENYLTDEFILPLNSFITSAFGKARVYNGSLKGYHSGTDFRAKIGTPIQASNDGVVVLVKNRFYSGGTVLINHGQGIYSCYFHMSKFNVKVGQMVKKTDIIGLSGDSGRVTGPHLHFAFRVAGVQVDPLQFIELMNKNLLNKEER